MSYLWNVCKDCVYWRVYIFERVWLLGVGSKINIESDELGRKWKSRLVILVGMKWIDLIDIDNLGI